MKIDRTYFQASENELHSTEGFFVLSAICIVETQKKITLCSSRDLSSDDGPHMSEKGL